MFENYQKDLNTDEFNELCMLWSEIEKCQDVARKKLLVNRFQRFWSGYDRQKKTLATKALRIKGCLSPEMARAVDVFNGTILNVQFESN